MIHLTKIILKNKILLINNNKIRKDILSYNQGGMYNPLVNIISKRYIGGNNKLYLSSKIEGSSEKISKDKILLNEIMYGPLTLEEMKLKIMSNVIIRTNNIIKDKNIILNGLKNKSGIYMFINKINGKKYIGSSVDLRRRLLSYLNVKYLKREDSMIINKALLKHKYNNFEFMILEFCNKSQVLNKELFYFKIYNPEYNILKIPGSPIREPG